MPRQSATGDGDGHGYGLRYTVYGYGNIRTAKETEIEGRERGKKNERRVEIKDRIRSTYIYLQDFTFLLSMWLLFIQKF